MQDPTGVSSAVDKGGARSDGDVKQLQAQLFYPSLKNLAPEAKSVKEMGAKFDLGSKVGMTQINTAESTKIQAGPEMGKGGLVDEVF